ncbi:uncharacterized protein J8A68_002559 [[Candida] subhashii]|uniref:Uncharacterized protein n=1 Tax=[Candida] subhashii TaxID=561895 RepID=A0A8J5UQ18_9ASCO|nr:uncharacterized protein J8A68_002559 [[Candida] subhashii]KAG7663932.1 hypothetical protein J8A68_002559 [[Candida] subhashii]
MSSMSVSSLIDKSEKDKQEKRSGSAVGSPLEKNQQQSQQQPHQQSQQQYQQQPLPHLQQTQYRTYMSSASAPAPLPRLSEVHQQPPSSLAQQPPPPQQQPHPMSISSSSGSSTNPLQPSTIETSPGLLALLGPNITSFPYSEKAFIEALKLRTEQERTKQDYYRVETANKNMTILQTALRAQIPPHLIPGMCVGAIPELTEEQTKAMSQAIPNWDTRPPQPQQQPFPQQQPYPQQPIVAYPQPQQLTSEQQMQYLQQQQRQVILQQQSQQQQQQPRPNPPPQGYPESGGQPQFQKSHRPSTSSSRITSDTMNANPIPPMSYRFGAGTNINKRPLSPAKIGAAAVANLATPTVPYRGSFSTGRRAPMRGHQRHYSMPAESPGSSISTSSNVRATRSSNRRSSQSSIDLSAIESTEAAYASGKRASVGTLQSPLGAQSTIQVKPIPAQPLHKQSKSQVAPSQESMTSFQHIIQFHHWKPEGPTVGTGDPSRAHKRHKSVSNDEISQSRQSRQSTPRHSVPPMPSPLQRPMATPQEEEQTSRPPTGSSRETTVKQESGLEQDPNSSIDTSMNDTLGSKIIPEDVNPPSGHGRSESNVGRYPHNIMSQNQE